jgi:hypothetical protein
LWVPLQKMRDHADCRAYEMLRLPGGLLS